jgi:hypothetical protein
MPEAFGLNQPQLEQVRRVEIKTLLFQGATNYTREIVDVVINHSDNDSEQEVSRSQPEVFWGVSKSELIARLTAQIPTIDFEERYLLESAINQLENEV